MGAEMNFYRMFYVAAGLTAILIGACMFDGPQNAKMVLMACGFLGLVACAFLTLGFCRKWKGGRVSPLLVAGIAFIVGGAVFDVCATLIHSPDLEHEANPLARTLLDAGISVDVVLLLGGSAQAFLVFTSVMIWMNLIIRLRWYEDRVREPGPSGLLGRLFGVPERGFRFMMGKRNDPEIAICGLGFLIVPIFAYRWYLGLEWFEVVPISRIFVPVAMLVATLAFQWFWAFRLSKKAGLRVVP